MTIPEIPSLDDAALTARLQARLDGKTKPLGSQSQLERLALHIGQILDTEAPGLRAPSPCVRPRLVYCCVAAGTQDASVGAVIARIGMPRAARDGQL